MARANVLTVDIVLQFQEKLVELARQLIGDGRAWLRVLGYVVFQESGRLTSCGELPARRSQELAFRDLHLALIVDTKHMRGD